MTATPLVSIVLPTHNGSRYLAQSIQSCLDQTYANWELILVDDCSTDSTPELLAQYAASDNRIRSVRHQTNRGLPAALNTGFACARGEYLTWTSDDNLYRPEALSQMVVFLQSHPAVDIVYADYTIIDEGGHEMWCRSVRQPEDLHIMNCVGACFLHTRAVHETLGGYSEDLRLAEDYDFWMRASVCFVMRPLHKDLYLYRDHARSLSRQQAEVRLLVRELALSRNVPKMVWLGRKRQATGYVRLARMALVRSDVAAGRGRFRCALRLAPLTAVWNLLWRTRVRHLVKLAVGQEVTDLLSKKRNAKGC